MKITINIDNRGYKNKADAKAAAGAISNRVRQESGKKEIEPEQLLDYIRGGYSITAAAIGGNIDEWKPYGINETTGKKERIPKDNPATGKKYCTSDFWESQQVIYADIDNEKKDETRINRPLTPAAALEACRAAGIDPFCIFKTLSYAPDYERFRVIVILDRPITDIKKADVLIQKFTQLFNLATAKEYQEAKETPEKCADSSIEPVKLMFGGRDDSIVYHSANITPIEALEGLPPIVEEIKQQTKQSAVQAKNKRNSTYTYEQPEEERIIEALFAIDPRNLGQGEWLPIVAACKHEGIPESIIDEWSAQDPIRYNAEMNHIRYLSIEGASGKGEYATKQSIYYKAWRAGWNPTYNNISDDDKIDIKAAIEELDRYLAKADQGEEDTPSGSIQEQPCKEEPEKPSEAPGEGTAAGNNSASDSGSKGTEEQKPKNNIKIYNAAESIRPKAGGAVYDKEIAEIQKYANRKTGFSNIDKYLTLYPGLAALGGQASLGKTTFAVNLALSLLEQGEHVLYFALEQRAEELLTKVIAQYLYKTGNTDTTNLQLSAGKTSHAIEAARLELADKIKHFHIIECDFETTAAMIETIVNTYQDKTGIKPLVIVDYLQLIAEPEEFRGGDKERIDYNLKALKKMQKQHKLFVLVVSSFNRSSNLEPISYESFFGTSMIEYTCDYVFGLQLAIQDADNDEFYVKTGPQGGKSRREDYDKKKMLHEAQQQTPKQVQFVSIKNRRGRQYFTANFGYYPAHDYFVEAEGSNYSSSRNVNLDIIEGTIAAAKKKNIQQAFNLIDDDDE